MRMIVWVLAGVFCAPSIAVAQTAAFKCPNAGTVTEFSDTTRVTWGQAEANRCQTSTRYPDALVRVLEERGKDIPGWFYAPTMSSRADRNSAWIDQLKPWTLWPLHVGKKLTGRFDGTGGNASYQGTWYYTVNVDAYERLSVKAGTFDTFVVSRTEEGANKYRSTLKQWYAPSLGVTVKYSFTDNQGANRSADVISITPRP